MNKSCQIFTPNEYALKLLDLVDYNKNIYGKKILENACGDGQILVPIVTRYIQDCFKSNMSKQKIKKGLEEDIYGIEFDKMHHHTCIENLNKVAYHYEIDGINWQILNCDSLKTNLSIKFDYIIGNPPYITYRNLDIENRIFLRNNFMSCKHGKFDYCYAFIENSIKYLNQNGILAYLIPNSIFKTVFAQNLRNLILPYLTSIYDFSSQKLFPNALISSAMIVIKQNSKHDTVNYYDIVNDTSKKIKKEDLKDKWQFYCNIKGEGFRFSDYFKASNTIATLYNKAFIVAPVNEINDYLVLPDGSIIEKDICRPTCSPRSYSKINQFIIFPYKFINNSLSKYSEGDLKQQFPYAYEHLLKYQNQLNNRKSDEVAKWYEYGRTQAIANMNQPKLLISSLITKKVHTYQLDSYNIPYSGFYITSIDNFDIKTASKILESEAFLNYVKQIGINASGESLRITVKDINNFVFKEL